MTQSLERNFVPIQVIIVTGFLGSGKTTLLNRILKEPQLSDSLVIVNEFGEVGIDRFLLDCVNDEVIELSSGCLCCTIRGNMIDTLEDLIGKYKNGTISNVKRVIIETTGLADPIPIIQSFLLHPFLKSHFRLMGVITCVDLVMGIYSQFGHNEAERQIAAADSIVFTKSDLIDEISTNSQKISALVARMKSLNPGATMLDFASGKLEIEKLFNFNKFSMNSNSNYETNLLNSSKQYDFQQNNVKSKNDKLQLFENSHDNRAHSFSLVNEHMMSVAALESFLDYLASSYGSKLLRTKGIVGVLDHPDFPMSVNGVRHVFHPLKKLNEWPNSDRFTKLVFITEEFADSELRKLFFAFAGISNVDTPDMNAVKENPLAIAGFSTK